LRIALWTPFPYISYAPARIFVAFEVANALRLLAIQVLWIGVGILIARLVFARGSRKIALNGG
jgi:ABC-2 type transport system permease protein